MASKIIGSFGKYGPHIHVVDTKDSVDPEKKSRHVEIRNPQARDGRGSKRRLYSDVPPHWSNNDIILRLRKRDMESGKRELDNVNWNHEGVPLEGESRADRKRSMRGESLEEAGRFAQYLNTVNTAKRTYKPGQRVFVKGTKGVEFQFHRYDDDGSAIVGTGGKKYRVHPLNVTQFSEAKNEPTVLSGGKHNEEPGTKRSGKRDNITVFDGNSNATVRMKTKTEETDLGEGKALTVAQRLQRGRQIKRIKPKLKRGAKRALSQSPSASRIWKRSERAARNLLKKRFSPVKGVSYSKLSITQKIFVDRTLEKRQKLIKKVAKRLLPKVRAASFKRLQSYRAGTGRSRLRENEAFEAQFNQRPLPQIIESMIIDMGDHPMADSLMTLLDLTAAKDSPAVRSLKEKAESINVPFVEVLQVYADALLEYKRSGSKLTGEQYAFNAVNVYVADRKAPTINEKFENMSGEFELQEKFTSKPHGKKNKKTKGGHHLYRNGEHRADLILRSESPDGHLYACHPRGSIKPLKNNKGDDVLKTRAAWLADDSESENGSLESHFAKHDKLIAMRTGKKKVIEAKIPADDAFEKFGAFVDLTQGTGHPVERAKNVLGTAGILAADAAKEKAKKAAALAAKLKNRLDKRHLHKEE